PVASFGIERLLARSEHHLAAVVAFVPTDGVEKKAAILCQTILQRLASNEVRRELRQKLRPEGIQGVRITANREPVALQRAGDHGQVECSLAPGKPFDGSGRGYRQQRSKNTVRVKTSQLGDVLTSIRTLHVHPVLLQVHQRYQPLL